MIIVDGSLLCPDCRNVKIHFGKFGIASVYKYTNANLLNLKELLKYRDGCPEVFEHHKKIGDIGLRCCIDGNFLFADCEGYLLVKGHKELVCKSVFSSRFTEGEDC